jgi:DNA-directed RNA polymerase sigma subunit (sigma70/sigma32)
MSRADRDFNPEGAPDERDECFREREILSLYLQEISGISPSTPDEQQALALRVTTGDREAKARLVETNLGLVVRIARGYVSRGLPLADLIEEGNLALLRAVRQLRRGREATFDSYAAWRVRQTMVRALANQARSVRLSAHMEALLKRSLKEKTRLRRQLGRNPTVEEIASAMGIPAERLAELEKAAGPRKSPSLQAAHGVGPADLLL